MRHYRVYKLDARGRITGAQWIEAEGEPEARSKAHALCDEATPTVELWDRAIKLAVLPCDEGEKAA